MFVKTGAKPHWVISQKSLASERYDRLIAYRERVLITITTTATLVMCSMLNVHRSGFIKRCEQLYSHHNAYFRGRLKATFLSEIVIVRPVYDRRACH